MKIYNSMNKKKEQFIPLEENRVKMYACGITVYDECHLGHARQAITFDVIARYLRYKGYSVVYVRNYTDVDDKIIKKANELGIDPLIYSKQRIKAAENDLSRLAVIEPDITPKVSESIDDIIIFITSLIKKGYSYVSESGDVYFSVEKFQTYGKLSKRKTDESINGVRKNVEEGKINPSDFALWKAAKEGEIYWQSPWGKGRPGWHIECSAMILKNLGETIDIHGGGKDLVFPHHENEIAQTEALTGKPFAKYWVHNGLIKVNGQKMSKSLGNSLTIKQVLELYEKEVIRYSILSKHYSTDVDLNENEFLLAEKHLYYFYNTIKNIDEYLKENKDIKETNNIDDKDESIIKNIKLNFIVAMDDDFNSATALAELFQICKYVNGLLKDKTYSLENKKAILSKIKEEVVDTYKLLGIMQEECEVFINSLKNKYLLKSGLSSKEIEDLITKRTEAKLNKDYVLADKIRNELEEKKIIVNDLNSSTTWDLKELYNI